MLTTKTDNVKYLENKSKIDKVLSKYSWSQLLNAMIEKLDTIEDLNNKQTIEVFKIIDNLQNSINSYERIKDKII